MFRVSDWPVVALVAPEVNALKLLLPCAKSCQGTGTKRAVVELPRAPEVAPPIEVVAPGDPVALVEAPGVLGVPGVLVPGRVVPGVPGVVEVPGVLVALVLVEAPLRAPLDNETRANSIRPD